MANHKIGSLGGLVVFLSEMLLELKYQLALKIERWK